MSAAPADPDERTPLARALDLLGLAPGELLSTGSQVPGGTFRGRQATVRSLAALDPIPADRDLWAGLCPMARVGPGLRGSASDVVRVPALWVDLDVRCKVKPTGGMPDLDAARAVIEDLAAILGSEPVYVTGSGHGLQPVWAIEEADSRDVDRARALVPRFGLLARRVAEARGGTTDSVYDLARVLRVPGSVNHKDPAEPVATSWEPRGGRPLSWDEVAEALDAHAVPEVRAEELAAEAAPEASWPWAEETCHYVRAMVAAWPTDAPAERHYWNYSQCVRLSSARRLGCVTEADHEAAVRVLRERTMALRAGDEDGQRPEETRLNLRDAVARTEARTEEACRAELGDHAHEHDRPGPVRLDVGPNLERDVFEASGTLREVRDAALSRHVSPWVVLASVLAHVVAEVPAHWTLPPIVGSDASLNLALAIVGPSGAGKSTGFSCGGDLVQVSPRLASRIGPGSGEGLTQAFLVWDPETKSNVLAPHPQAVLYADEIGTIEAVDKRLGATLGPVLRSMLTGDEVSQQNADTGRRRRLARLSYRLTLVAGVQPALSEILLKDADAGLPQRFVWLPASGHGVPDERPAHPGPLRWRLPTVEASRVDPLTGRIRLGLPDEAVALVRQQRALAEAADPFAPTSLDGHAVLTRLKVAAACALLHGRLDVTRDDWTWSGHVMRVSNAMRDGCARAVGCEGEKIDKARGRADARRQEAAREYAAERAARDALPLWRVVAAGAEGKHGAMTHDPGAGCTRRCLSWALRHRPGADLDAAIGAAEAHGWLEERDARWHPGPSRPADES